MGLGRGNYKGNKETFEGDACVHYLDVVMVTQVYTYVKTFQLYTLNICNYCMPIFSIKLFEKNLHRRQDH